MAFQPLALDFIEQALRSSPDVEVVDRLGPKGLMGTLADGLGGVPNVVVVKMADDQADIAQKSAPGCVLRVLSMVTKVPDELPGRSGKA